MYYISLDLEWNQAYAQKALAVQKRLCARLRGEDDLYRIPADGDR